MSSDAILEWVELNHLIEPDRPICYGVLKPGPFAEGGIPLVRILDIEGDELATDGLFRISDALDKEFARSRLEGGELLLSIQGTVGRVAVFPKGFGPANISRTIARLAFTDTTIATFLRHWFRSQEGQRAIDNAIVGSTRSSLNIGVLRRLCVPHFGGVEKICISKILDTLDTAIHETEAIIAKLKAVKQGLLHDLLTRGIDASGELRPPQAETPHLYKQSPLGWIPMEWDAHVLGETIAHVIDFRGRTPKKLGMDWGGGDILALSANNVQPGVIDISRESYLGGERLYRKWMTSGDVRKGDVLLTMEAPLGNVAQIPDDARYILSQRVIALRFNAGVVLNDFAFWQMQGNEFQQAMVRRSTGSTATGIQRAELVKLRIKAPPVLEQSLIAVRLSSIQHKLDGERLVLAKQLQQKAGLMDDLLTGRVRVTPLLAADLEGSA